MEYFKPMLKNKNLTMCQDVTPNTAEGKELMYAITWNEAGTRNDPDRHRTKASA